MKILVGTGILLLMAEILHHLGCIKPCKWWDKLPINWCRISSINSRTGFASPCFPSMLVWTCVKPHHPQNHWIMFKVKESPSCKLKVFSISHHFGHEKKADAFFKQETLWRCFWNNPHQNFYLERSGGVVLASSDHHVCMARIELSIVVHPIHGVRCP